MRAHLTVHHLAPGGEPTLASLSLSAGLLPHPLDASAGLLPPVTGRRAVAVTCSCWAEGNRHAHVVSGVCVCVGGLCCWHLCVEGEPPVMGSWTASRSFGKQEAPACPLPSRGSLAGHPIQPLWCTSNCSTRLSGGKAMWVLILLHSWDPSLSTRLGAVSQRVSWLMDGRLRRPCCLCMSGGGDGVLAHQGGGPKEEHLDEPGPCRLPVPGRLFAGWGGPCDSSPSRGSSLQGGVRGRSRPTSRTKSEFQHYLALVVCKLEFCRTPKFPG